MAGADAPAAEGGLRVPAQQRYGTGIGILKVKGDRE